MTTVSFPADQGITPPWRDTTLSVADRVDLLLQGHLREEKVDPVGNGQSRVPPRRRDPLVGRERDGRHELSLFIDTAERSHEKFRSTTRHRIATSSSLRPPEGACFQESARCNSCLAPRYSQAS